MVTLLKVVSQIYRWLFHKKKRRSLMPVKIEDNIQTKDKTPETGNHTLNNRDQATSTTKVITCTRACHNNHKCNSK